MTISYIPVLGIQLTRPSDRRRSFARISEVLPIPNLIRVQTDSYNWFIQEGLKELFAAISPIEDFTRKSLILEFRDYTLGIPKYTERECRERGITYAAPLRVKAVLTLKETGEIKEQEIFMGDFPLMTQNGTFIINGAERVVVSQLVRSPGVYFTLEEDPTTGRSLCYAKLIPNRGAWLEFETSNKDVLSVKVDRKRKIPVTTILRAIGYGTDEQLIELFKDVDTSGHRYIQETIARDTTKSTNEALLEFYRRLRPGDPPNIENAKNLIDALFFNFRRYDLGKVGRYKINKRLGLAVPLTTRILTKEDFIKIIEMIIRLNNGEGQPDDIDHLGNRRVRSVGELIQNQFRIGLLRMERVVRERMSIQDPEAATPASLINTRPIVAAMREFFGGSQLSQFMDQTNPLAELTHKRRLSALGPGGLHRKRAGMEVRDVHHSHYGRICPIETPEGPNIGLIGSLGTYALINEYGFIETPYRRVYNTVDNQPEQTIGRILREKVTDPNNGEVVANAGEQITPDLARRLATLPFKQIKAKPFVSKEIVYLSADEEDQYYIAQANSRLDKDDHFIDSLVEVRHTQQFYIEPPERVQFMDVSPKQIVSVATALIPFLEHDDANRALMGSNMQRQAVPLIKPEAPYVGTGMEWRAAYDSGQVIISKTDGEVGKVTAEEIVVIDDQEQPHTYQLQKFIRSNQGTCINQRPIVELGQRVRKGQPLADSSSTDQGELALGQNVLVAFMSWEGSNFEDAIIISERIVREDKFTSIHMEKYEVEARDTKLGPEEITRDIPNVGEDTLRDLDEQGIIRIGAEVGPGDILVGKITPKGETELTAEERLLRAIFGEKAREVKDTSLRVPHGERGKVVDVKKFSRENHNELPAGVNQLVQVSIAQKRKIAEGDKMAGRHGNKGVIARILPIEDMPILPDGTPVDIILNPIGVPSRMNVGQVLETHLGWAADMLGLRIASPVFDGAREEDIKRLLTEAWLHRLGAQEIPSSNDEAERLVAKLWLSQSCNFTEITETDIEEAIRQNVLPNSGKIILYDGRTGEPFDQPVTVGNIYMMKLVHLVEDKIHARSTGPYSLITQQPLGGKAQFGGQRFGEMEVWALEAYGAAHTLQEMLTVKSDDVIGRVKTYEAIIKGENILEPGVPESFKVLVKELQSLGLAVEVLNEEEESVQLAEDMPIGDESLLEFGIT
ncbi:MAG: DNA-directed RNA polymerase subunit beta [Chloroflexi bacterium]|nr:DNA-directed RNA polymerase subunit beta [Chloroflexota bacterium]MCL5074259.1 DNA-directed RNA polymerase subunit beta [Chloroflexota bacterium]